MSFTGADGLVQIPQRQQPVRASLQQQENKLKAIKNYTYHRQT
jgi:hypothetical protein